MKEHFNDANYSKCGPRPILRGIKDESGRPLVYQPDFLPTHLPHVYLFTERGPTLPQLVSGDKLVGNYGAKSFEYRGRYANHQTVLANTINAEGNRMMVQRVVPPGANPRQHCAFLSTL